MSQLNKFNIKNDLKNFSKPKNSISKNLAPKNDSKNPKKKRYFQYKKENEFISGEKLEDNLNLKYNINNENINNVNEKTINKNIYNNNYEKNIKNVDNNLKEKNENNNFQNLYSIPLIIDKNCLPSRITFSANKNFSSDKKSSKKLSSSFENPKFDKINEINNSECKEKIFFNKNYTEKNANNKENKIKKYNSIYINNFSLKKKIKKNFFAKKSLSVNKRNSLFLNNKLKNIYIPRMYSEEILKKWEKLNNKNWYNLSPKSRAKANEEMSKIKSKKNINK